MKKARKINRELQYEDKKQPEIQNYVAFNFSQGDGLIIYSETVEECKTLLKQIYACFYSGSDFFYSKQYKFMIAKASFIYGYVSKKDKS